jgi:hypothetical protein
LAEKSGASLFDEPLAEWVQLKFSRKCAPGDIREPFPAFETTAVAISALC